MLIVTKSMSSFELKWHLVFCCHPMQTKNESIGSLPLSSISYFFVLLNRVAIRAKCDTGIGQSSFVKGNQNWSFELLTFNSSRFCRHFRFLFVIFCLFFVHSRFLFEWIERFEMHWWHLLAAISFVKSFVSNCFFSMRWDCRIQLIEQWNSSHMFMFDSWLLLPFYRLSLLLVRTVSSTRVSWLCCCCGYNTMFDNISISFRQIYFNCFHFASNVSLVLPSTFSLVHGRQKSTIYESTKWIKGRKICHIIDYSCT